MNSGAPFAAMRPLPVAQQDAVELLVRYLWTPRYSVVLPPLSFTINY